MTEKPVDAHCHLDFGKFNEDREEVIRRCKDKLSFVVNSGRDPKSNQDSLELQEKHDDFIYATAGIHPTHTDSFSELEKVKKQIQSKDFYAVGEIGMDFHHVEDEDLRSKQREVFINLVELAENEDLPVVVHSRNAEKQVIDIIEEYDVKTYLHCFNGNIKQVERAIENNAFIGVTYQVTYSNRVQEVVDHTPIENIVLETDSPFLKRGERNTPLTVEKIAEKIGEIKNISKEKVVSETTKNTTELFDLN